MTSLESRVHKVPPLLAGLTLPNSRVPMTLDPRQNLVELARQEKARRDQDRVPWEKPSPSFLTRFLALEWLAEQGIRRAAVQTVRSELEHHSAVLGPHSARAQQTRIACGSAALRAVVGDTRVAVRLGQRRAMPAGDVAVPFAHRGVLAASQESKTSSRTRSGDPQR